MSEQPVTNGPADGERYIHKIDPEDPEYIKQMRRPAEVKEDVTQMETRKRVQLVLNSQAFRDELEQIVNDQTLVGASPSSIAALHQLSELLLPQRSHNQFSKATGSVIPISDIRGVDSLNYGKGEKMSRCKMASLYRLVDLMGWSQNNQGLVTVMTGVRNGVGVQLKRRINPFLIQLHCVAHKLALVTSQAADHVTYLKNTYQEFLTGIYYYFKHSAIRSNALSEMQKALDSDVLKCKEVHSVRWFSFYNSLDTVFRSWEPLVLFFEQQVAQSNDPKAKGFLKTMKSSNFVIVTHILMDIIPIMTNLNMVFQKQNLDLSIVVPAIKNCKEDLIKLKETPGNYEASILQALGDGKEYKGIGLVDNANFRTGASNVKQSFINNIVEQLDKRFPEDSKNIVNALSILGLRGIRFIAPDKLPDWGSNEIQILCDQYKSYQKDEDTHVEGYISESEVKMEWPLLVKLVIDQKYVYSNMSELWQIIHRFHRDDFPHLLKLASIALVMPAHTADVERGFSAQNLVKTAHRNRLSSAQLQILNTIKLNGPDPSKFDFKEALNMFKQMKKRKVMLSVVNKSENATNSG